jgi:hypothetical protein
MNYRKFTPTSGNIKKPVVHKTKSAIYNIDPVIDRVVHVGVKEKVIVVCNDDINILPKKFISGDHNRYAIDGIYFKTFLDMIRYLMVHRKKSDSFIKVSFLNII